MKLFSSHIPRPIQVVIDDVGWWSGKDGSLQNEPYRTGIGRNHCIADYQAIIDLGKALNIRPQAAMVLCEWDRENILRDIPDSTWMGKNWDNRQWVGPWLDKAADLINSNLKHFEFTLHGIGHEFWSSEGAAFSRAEWASSKGTMRSPTIVEAHLDYYQKIMMQNQLGDFPVSFVPTSFNHGFGITGDHKQSIAQLVRKRGITYINTPFSRMQNVKDIPHEFFGIDDGVMTIDRGQDLMKWLNVSTIPEGLIKGTTCGMHWPNLLHEDPDRNHEIVEAWVNFLRPYHEHPDTMLAPNSDLFQQQLVHHGCTKLWRDGSSLLLDFSVSDKVGLHRGCPEFSLKISSKKALNFQCIQLNIKSIEEIKLENAILYTLFLERKDGSTSASLDF